MTTAVIHVFYGQTMVVGRIRKVAYDSFEKLGTHKYKAFKYLNVNRQVK